MEQEQKARLLHSGLRFRRVVTDAAEDALLQMIANNTNFKAVEFSTENNRQCCLVLAIGEEMVNLVKSRFKKQQTQEQ